jgi:zinc protease
MEFLGTKARLIAAGLAGWMVGCASRPPVVNAIAPPTREFRVQQINLPSGMQLLVEDSADELTVASVLVFGAGAAQEPPGQEGLAHLVEHLAFRAHGPGQPSIRQRLVDEGIGYHNAATLTDATHYDQLARPELLPAMVRIEAARLTAPLDGIDEGTFAVEREVVLNELLWRYGNDRFPVAQDALFRQLYPPGNPYAHGVAGTAESLARLTLDDARTFVRTWYRPEHVTWVIAGKVDRPVLLKTLKEVIPPELSDVPHSGREPAPVLPPPDPPPRPPLQTLSGPWEARQLVIAWTLPPAHGSLQSVVSSLPAVVASQVHVDEVKHQTGTLREMDASSVLIVVLELEPKASANEVLSRFLAKLPGSWPNDWYRPGTRAYWAFSLLRTELLEAKVRATESLLSRARLRALEVHRTRSALTLSLQADSVLAMQFPELVRLGQQYVTPERARAVLLEPTVPVALDPESASHEVAHLELAAPARDHSHDEIAALATSPGFEVQGFRASNGLDVLVAPMGHRDVVSVVLAVPAGRATTPRPGIAEVTALAMYKSTLGRGIVIDRRWSQDSGLVRLQGAPSQLPELLERLAAEVNVRISALAEPASLRFKDEPSESRFDRRFWRALYGPSRYAVRATEADIRATSVGDVNDWLHRTFDPAHAVLVVAGDVQGDVRREVELRLGDWRDRQGHLPAPFPAPPHPGKLRLVTDVAPKRSQVAVRFGCVMQGQTLADEIAAELLGIELEQRWYGALRSAAGATYRVAVSVDHHRDGANRDLVARMEVQGSRLPQVAAELQRTWHDLPGLLADPLALRRVQWEFARRRSVSFATGLALAMELADERLRGRSATVLDDASRTMLAIGTAELSAVSRDCQQTSMVGLQGPQATIESPTLLPEGERVDPGP